MRTMLTVITSLSYSKYGSCPGVLCGISAGKRSPKDYVVVLAYYRILLCRYRYDVPSYVV